MPWHAKHGAVIHALSKKPISNKHFCRQMYHTQKEHDTVLPLFGGFNFLFIAI